MAETLSRMRNTGNIGTLKIAVPVSCDDCYFERLKYSLPLSTNKKGVYCEIGDRNNVVDLECDDNTFKFEDCPIKVKEV